MPKTKTPASAEPSYTERYEAPGADKVATAQRAVQAFKNLCPDLSIFASVLAGKPATGKGSLTVLPGSATCTDGTRIYLRPDARLAGSAITDTEWSEIKAGLFHEVAHIVFDSFKAITDEDRADAIRHLTETLPESLRRDVLLAHLTDLGAHGANYKSMSGVFHPQMPNLVNALEDARVERALFDAKPGTQKHLEALRGKIFDADRDEIVALIGLPWNERDADSQAVIGCYLLGCGYPVERRLTDEVAAILRDIEPLIVAASEAPAVDVLYARCFDVLTALQARGLLRNHDDRDEPAGETEHPDAEESFGGAVGGVDDACPHPKAMIVPCASPDCTGNCTLCGAHIVSAPSPSPEGTGEGDGTPGTSEEASDDEGEAKPGAGGRAEAADAGESSDASASAPDSGDADGAPSAGASHADTSGEAPDEAEGDADGADDDAEGADAEGASDDADAAASDDPEADAEAAAEAAAMAEAEAEATARREAEEKAAETAEAFDKSGGHSEPDDDLDDSALETAVSLDEHGYSDERLTSGVGGIKYAPASKEMAPLLNDGRDPVNRAEAERAIAVVLPELRQMLALNGRTGFTNNMRAGRIDAQALYRTATGHTRVFGRYTTPQTRDYLFVIALDCSGSFGHSSSAEMKLEKSVALVEAEMLNRLAIPFIMFGFSGDTGAGRSRAEYNLVITDIKGENEPWDERSKKRLDRLDSFRANLDGSTMQYSRIRGRRATRNAQTQVIVLHHSDGGFPAENPYAEKARIRAEVRNAAMHNVHYVGIGINTDDPGRAGLDLVEVRRPQDASRVVKKIATLIGLR